MASSIVVYTVHSLKYTPYLLYFICNHASPISTACKDYSPEATLEHENGVLPCFVAKYKLHT